MIVPLPPAAPLAECYRAFLDALAAAGFQGEIAADRATRTVLATDNSIYQRLPQAALFPRDIEDVRRIARLAAEPRFRQVVLAPRGGGTGTNGQSLTDGLVVDLSRHLTGILEINAEEGWVRVQAGVVKDRLNAALKPHGLFFAPELSTSNRATLGGMINTDASGQGSCTYGKTRDHVLALDTVLLGGELLSSAPLDDAELERQCSRDDRVGAVYRCARQIADGQRELIAERFPPLNRCLTGYDLAHLRPAGGGFDLNSVLCGAEGTLGLVVEAKLQVLPIPRHAILVNVRYPAFMDALRDARALMALAPLSIETVDSRVLQLARQDSVWQQVAEFFPDDATPAQGINLVEFCGDDLEALETQVADFLVHLGCDSSVPRLGHTLAHGQAAVTRVYAMRKRAVGLLGNVAGEARPQPFVEDSVVPPGHLADYIAEFRALLDGHGLQYGMFGHVDAGVLHVRPLLDMKDPRQAALIRPLSDGVAALAHKYGGLLWGEHGKGLRSEYAPTFFGPLYPALQTLKGVFDPHNQLNPGKIATPLQAQAALTRLDEVALRGEFDRQIDESVWQSYQGAVHCNGNGACFNYDTQDAMCPSWKATGERVHSPKGRASLVREWLRLQQERGVDVLATAQRLRRQGALRTWLGRRRQRGIPADDFNHEVYAALRGCLACKSCSGQCPVKVDVPDFRARFLELYHGLYPRPLKDYLVAVLEFAVPWLVRLPGLYNGLLSLPPVEALVRRIGLVDSPRLARFPWRRHLRRWNVETATPARLRALDAAERRRAVVLVPDAFTRYFETPLLADCIELLARLGYRVYLAPFRANGKPLQVHGFLGAFERVCRSTAGSLRELSDCGVALVGLDPAMTLVYRQEYRKVLGEAGSPPVQLLQEWLHAQALPELAALAAGEEAYRLLPHCTERTNAPASAALWPALFARFGLPMRVQASGCCGMSGTYGHEREQQESSRQIYALSWQGLVAADAGSGQLLATGYSCRCQVERLDGQRLRHPLQVLLGRLRQTQEDDSCVE